MKKIIQTMIVLLIHFASASSEGAEVCSGFISNGNAQYKMGTINVPIRAPNGAVLASIIVELPYSCVPSSQGYRFEAIAQPGYWKETSIPGVITSTVAQTGPGQINAIWAGAGLRVTNLETGTVITGAIGNPVPWGPSIPPGTPQSGTLRAKVDLVKISDAIYDVSILPIGWWKWGDIRVVNNVNSATSFWKMHFDVHGPLTYMPQSCTVTTPNVPVRLPPTAATKLNTVGATAGDTGFNIGLSCKTGTSVYVTLTDLTNTGNTSNQLTLTPDSTAKGVKLRILNKGQPVGYGPDSSEIGNLNQWYVGPSASTTSIPLAAQYIATDKVSAGTVKGVATFTMSYQ